MRALLAGFTVCVTAALVGACSSSTDTANPDTGTGVAGSAAGGAANGGKGGSGGGGAGKAGATAGGSGGASVSCSTDADCSKALPPTTPPNCAVGTCDPTAHTCKFHPPDADMDGHYAIGCTGAGVAPGDDCNDADKLAYPGAWDGPKDPMNVTLYPDSCNGADNDCNGMKDDGALPDGTSCSCTIGAMQSCVTDPNGMTINFPGGKPQGACKAGQQKCAKGASGKGEWGTCQGAITPLQFDSCTKKGADENCDGKPNEGCDCTDDQTAQPCDATAQGTIITWPKLDATGNPLGKCKRGTQKCGGGKWGVCTGAVAPGPRDCTSMLDNDCNGTPDNTHDAVCQCQPTDPTMCTGNPMFPMSNCPGTRMCQVTASTSTWSACNGPASCTCVDGKTQSCMSKNGMCTGSQTCGGGAWGPCMANGQTLPDNCACTSGSKTCGGAACVSTISCTNFAWPTCPTPDSCECGTQTTSTCAAIGAGTCGSVSCSNYSWNKTGCGGQTHYCADTDIDGHGDPNNAQNSCTDPGFGWTTDCTDNCDTVKSVLNPGCPSENGWWTDAGNGTCSASIALGDSNVFNDAGKAQGSIWSFGPSGAYVAMTPWWEYHWDAVHVGGGCYNSGSTNAMNVQCSNNGKQIPESQAGNPSTSSFHHDFGGAAPGGAGTACHVDQEEGWTPFAQGTCQRQFVNMLAIGYNLPKGCYP